MSCFARHPRSSTALLFTVGVIAVSTPTEARACSPDVCASSSRFDAIELRHDVVGDRSVLVFDARQGSRRTLDDLSAIQIAVTDGTAAKDGAVETIDGFDGFAWRPAAPLTAGSTLTVTVTVDNAAIDDVSCGPDLLEVTETVTVEPMESSTFAALTLEAQTQYGIDREFELDSIGCCDGAYPFDEFVCGADPFPMTGEGLCFGYEATGIFTADVSASGLNDDLTVARENDLLYRMFKDGEHIETTELEHAARVTGTEPFCVTLEALSLASGEVVGRDEQCFGGDVADELGFQTVDLEEDLAQCESAPYVSETMEKENGLLAWNPDDCMPWQYIEPAPVGDTDTEGKDASGLDAMGDEGCARSADGTAPGGASTLLSLGVLTSADDDSNDVRASNDRVSRLSASGARPPQRGGRTLGSCSSQRPSFVANRLRCHMARLSKMLAPSSNSSPRRRSTNAMTTWR